MVQEGSHIQMIRCVLSWCMLVMNVQEFGYLVTTPVEFRGPQALCLEGL